MIDTKKFAKGAAIDKLITLLKTKADQAGVTEALAGKADKVHTHTIAQVTNLQQTLDEKATKEELNQKFESLSSVYTPKGSKATFAEVLALTNAKVGDVWDVKAEFTLSGQKYPAGTNVACIKNTSADAHGEDCWDALGGIVDLKPINDKITKLEQKTTAIDAYTVNNKAIKTNPVLTADDIAINGFALSDKANGELMPAEGDSTKVVFGKVYKVIQDNETVTAGAFNKIKTVLGTTDTNFTMPDMSGTNYLKTATVFLDALKALDTQLKAANDKITTLETKLTEVTGKVTAIETNLANEVTAGDIDAALKA